MMRARRSCGNGRGHSGGVWRLRACLVDAQETRKNSRQSWITSRIQRERRMTHREKLDHDTTLSRRSVIQALAAGAGAVAAGAGMAQAQTAPVAPPSTV